MSYELFIGNDHVYDSLRKSELLFKNIVYIKYCKKDVVTLNCKSFSFF